MFLLKNEEYITKIIDLRLYTFFVGKIGVGLEILMAEGVTHHFLIKSDKNL